MNPGLLWERKTLWLWSIEFSPKAKDEVGFYTPSNSLKHAKSRNHAGYEPILPREQHIDYMINSPLIHWRRKRVS
ncbi:MAG: hypothetical protein JWO13_2536 [Acidobacteriales bacterium]|nr:hypothetical protein [Terriglobales bacterium]